MLGERAGDGNGTLRAGAEVGGQAIGHVRHFEIFHQFVDRFLNLGFVGFFAEARDERKRHVLFDGEPIEERAPDWKTMVTLLRISSNCASFQFVTSWPATMIWPSSGFRTEQHLQRNGFGPRRCGP